MNKIPFTSQNPYAFYAKTIDSYNTETNTRKAKKERKERNKSFKKRNIFSLLSANGKHLFRYIQYS